MKFSRRAMWLSLVAIALILVGGIEMALRPKLDAWRDLLLSERKIHSDMEAQRKIVAEGPRYESELKRVGSLLPDYPPDKPMDVHWLTIMDQLAMKRSVHTTRRRMGEEKDMGGHVREMSFESQSEGNLDALVDLLSDLQSAGIVMDTIDLSRFHRETNGTWSAECRIQARCPYRRSDVRPGVAGRPSPSR